MLQPKLQLKASNHMFVRPALLINSTNHLTSRLFDWLTHGGHEATDTGLAYAPVSQAHGHNHIVQCFACCTAA